MKILALRFCNLNSLYGEHSIDFQHPNYSSEGLFAITGPTGSGKTTLLDAVCLALYGQTPRLKNISQKQNELMSKGTGECFAELTFMTLKGTYRAHWSQRRAREQAHGKLQSAKHELSHYPSGDVLSVKLSETSLKIESLTGMNFQQFTRSMMLAQGDFAAFLKAKADERSPILEQITGTEIYSLISQQVHLQTAKHRKILENHEAEMKGIMLLPDDEVVSLEQEQSALQSQHKEITEQSTELNIHLQWHRQHQRLNHKNTQLHTAIEQHQKALAAFSPKQHRLDQADRAKALEDIFRQLQTNRDIFQQQQQQLNEVLSYSEQCTQEIKTTEKQLLEEGSLTLIEMPNWNFQDSLSIPPGAFASFTGARQAHLEQALQNYRAASNTLSRLHHERIKLDSELTDQKPMLQAFKIKQRLNKQVEGIEDKLKELKQGHSLETIQDHLEQLEKEQQHYIRFQSLEEHRQQLEDGQPCPLCGSMEHPYAKDDESTVHNFDQQIQDLKNRIKKIDQLQSKLAERSQYFQSLHTLLSTLQHSPSSEELEIKEPKHWPSYLQELEKWKSKNQSNNARLSMLEQQYQQQQEAYYECKNQFPPIRHDLQQLQQLIQEQQASLNEQEQDFIHLCKTNHFNDEHHFLSLRLNPEDYQSLTHEKSKLDKTSIELETRGNDLNQALEEHRKDQPTDLSFSLPATESEKSIQQSPEEELSEARDLFQKKLNTLHHDLGRITQKLKTNHQALLQLAQQIKKRDQLQNTLNHWSILNNLIGSHDGKKFRNFAQGLTFDLMIQQANQQLRRMTDRYLLRRDPEEALELQVIDQDQAGEIRSTKNLSGGESFLVSLALALGLSQMASQHARIDTLFLDEGFGTLDEQTLQQALDALGSLHQQGKLIGMISHVPALKERIHTQIKVEKLSGGRSRILGPGVRKD